MFRGTVGQKVWFIGQPGDQRFFEPLNLLEHPVQISQVPLAQAEGIVCTGPKDPMAAPDIMRPAFETAIARGLTRPGMAGMMPNASDLLTPTAWCCVCVRARLAWGCLRQRGAS